MLICVGGRGYYQEWGKESAADCGIHHGCNNPGTFDQYDIRQHEQTGFWQRRKERFR